MPAAVIATAVSGPPIRRRAARASPEQLAAEMGRTARELRAAWLREFHAAPGFTRLHEWHRSEAHTSSGPAPDATALADAFAQTLVYGSFIARFASENPESFDLSAVLGYFRQGPSSLRNFFDGIAGRELTHPRIATPVANLLRTLVSADIPALKKIFAGDAATDPLLHFYETFLAAYAPQVRGTRGVYYTPAPVVGWLVRSVDALLKSHFDFAGGLAEPVRDRHSPGDFMVCDPAAGTGAFLHAVMRVMRARPALRGAANGRSTPPSDVSQRLFGYELMLPPLLVAKAICHAERPDREPFNADPLRIHLADSLANAITPPLALRSAERLPAGPMPIIIGNPPYSGHSANHGENIARLVRDYYFVGGVPLRESNSKWLQDDYVKFIRWAQWQIEQRGCGIVAFVTNHRYLSNVTFPGMRQQLLETFDEIWVLDLHGSGKPRETCPDGSPDENVFDIQQGVALGIFVKLRALSSGKKRPARVHHADLYGTRAHKFGRLEVQDVATTSWTTITPQSPDYLFVPQDRARWEEYRRGWKVTDLMPEHSLGILSKRDALVVDFDRAMLVRRMEDFCDERTSDAEIARRFKLLPRDHDSWDLAAARRAVRAKLKDLDWRGVAYRPFDARVVAYEPELVARMNRRVLGHLTADNTALVIGRQGQATGSQPWDVVFATDSLVDQNIFARGGGTVFPLYLDSSQGRASNLAPEFIEQCSEHLRLRFVSAGDGDGRTTFGPADVQRYMYAILHAPGYRTRYAEFLRRDFPRVPLTTDRDLFWTLCTHGRQLFELHLLRAPERPRIAFPERGDNHVDVVTYHAASAEESGKVRINARQWFENVPGDAWSFRIGGFQVAEKWLKDRRGRVLTTDDCQVYSRIISALAETIRVQSAIDAAIASAGGWPLK